MQAEVVIAADAGTEVGLGHLARCSALAAALRERHVHVACRALGASEPVVIDGVDWLPVAGIDDLLAADPPLMFVIDSYHATSDQYHALAARAALAVLHDAGGAPAMARLVVTVAGPSSAGKLAGLEYACLRQDFWDLPPRRPSSTVSRVLLSTGGGDHDGSGTRWAAIVRDAVPQATTALLRGPYAGGSAPEGVEIVGPQPTLRRELLAADVLITAAGQTALEALAAGTPCIAIATVENQRRQAHKIADANAALVLEMPSDAELAAALTELCSNLELRRRLAKVAQTAVDGQGARRIAQRVVEIIGR